MATETLPCRWPKYPLLYEINARVWLTELSTRAGRKMTLDQVPPEEIERIAGLGFHGVWLMGVWTTGPEAVLVARACSDLQGEYRRALPDFTSDDVIGSPYAVSRYQVSGRLGGPAALASFREKLKEQGVRLVLDFVPNHTARDHWLVRECPDAFIRGTEEDLRAEPQNFFRTPEGAVLAHGRDPYFPAWTDTAQVNYGQPAGREAMMNELLSIGAQCDGVRCDMAMLLLPEVMQQVWGSRLGSNPMMQSFWKAAIAEVERCRPGFLFLAEVYWNLEWQLQQEGFHFTYDKRLYDRLLQTDYHGVRMHLKADQEYQNHCARFMENHDERRATEAFGSGRARSAAVATFFCPGLRLFHEGQLEGRRVKVPIQLGRRPHETPDVETSEHYRTILAVLADPIFQDGVFSLCDVQPAAWHDPSYEALVALSWDRANSVSGKQDSIGHLIVVNLSDACACGRIPLPAAAFSAGKHYIFHDRYDGIRYRRDGGELVSPGLYVALEAHQPHLFEIWAQE